MKKFINYEFSLGEYARLPNNVCVPFFTNGYTQMFIMIYMLFYIEACVHIEVTLLNLIYVLQEDRK